MENGDTLSLLLLSSHILPLSQCRVFPIECKFIQTSKMCSSQRLQIFRNCSIVGPFHKVQFFRNRLLQHGYPRGEVSWQKSAIYGLLSMGKSSYQEPSPGWALHGVTENRCLLLCGTLHGLQGGCLPLLSSPCTAGQSLLWHLEHFTAPQLLWCLCLQGCVLCHVFVLLSHRCCSIFLLFLKCYHRGTTTPLIYSA